MSGTVLVVDDDADARELLQLALERRGFQVTVVGSCADARAAVERHQRFDALVTDIELEDGSGLNLRGLAAFRFACTLTGHASPADAERAKAAGFDAHLVKPVDLEELVAVLGAVRGPTS